MAGLKGRDLLLRIEIPETPDSFKTLAGLRAKSISLSSSPIDMTHADSAGAWRELMNDGGTKSARISGRGILRDTEAEKQLREIFFTQSTHVWQICISGFGELTGPFIITELGLEGTYDSEASFSISLASAGEIRSSDASSDAL